MTDAPETTNGQTAGMSTPALLRVFSALINRLGLANRLGSSFGGRRKMHQILGYKPRLEYQDFKARYLRQDIAHRIVNAYPHATWAHPPQIEEADDGASQTPTPFEAAWKALATRLHVYATLGQTDILANLGQYAVILIGLGNQRDLRLPVSPVRSPDDILYLTSYSEEWAKIQQFDNDPDSPTFGKPLLYSINLGHSNGDRAQKTLNSQAGMVHASRIIHMAADSLLDDDIYGIPSLEPIFDRLDDLLKVVGGSAEMFWRDARRRIAYETREGFALQDIDEEEVGKQADEFAMDLTDWIRVEGVDVKALAGTVASPKEHYEVLLSLIAATKRIPKRILEGSERGSLASEQDEANWLQSVAQRQQHIAEPRYLRPLIDRLIALQALPMPSSPYTCEWEGLFSLSEVQQAQVTESNARALAAYAGPGMAETVVPKEEFRARYLGLPAVSPYATTSQEPL